jgi:hypothetical protein
MLPEASRSGWLERKSSEASRQSATEPWMARAARLYRTASEKSHVDKSAADADQAVMV